MIKEDERIYGDGVNINPPVEGLGKEGEWTKKNIYLPDLSYNLPSDGFFDLKC